MHISGKTVAIVQARMGSCRLPGKMLLPLAGRPLVDHVLARLLRICRPHGPLDGVALATSVAERDDPLARHVRDSWPGVHLVRGAEDDVLDRFVEAVKATGAATVIRVTGDCPFVNVDAITCMLDSHTKAGADITNYAPGYEYVDKGVEVISADALRRVAQDPETSARDREHVTAFLYRRPERFVVNYVESEPFLRRGDIRLTIDTQSDLDFCEALMQGLATPLETANLRDVVTYLDAHPELIRINSASGRKSTLHERARLGFRCDGGERMGLGHVVGCLRLARLAASHLGFGAEFVMRHDHASLELVKKAGFAVEVLSPDISPEEDIQRIEAKIVESDWSGVVFNFCKDDIDCYAPLFKRVKPHHCALIFMDNPVPPSCYDADLSINALPHPAYPGYDPTKHPACYDGLEYFLLPDGMPERQIKDVRPNVERVLVAMGGGDSVDATSLVLESLAAAPFQGYVDVVLGAANPRLQAISETFRRLGLQGTVSQGVTDLPARMAAADLAFSSLGLTTYEMASSGLPSLIVANSAFNAEIAEEFSRRVGASRALGLWSHRDAVQIACGFRQLATNVSERERMAMAGRSVGALAEDVIAAVNERIGMYRKGAGKT